jgi:hypothetical protein
MARTSYPPGRKSLWQKNLKKKVAKRFNVLICGSFASFWFLQKIKIVVLKKGNNNPE